MLRVLPALLAVSVAGCGSFLQPSSSPVPIQPDPSPLAKCRVGASAQSPLVTEWPASEKANLERLAKGQTVAVEYSGCELHIAAACVLPGAYKWKATTLATDSVEIGNQDELYAKLPIGAIALEGELKRSGRLAVRTTVAGQLVLEGADTTNVGREGACGRATHYVSAISVGAFKLLSGGNVAARAGVTVGNAGGGAAVAREIETLREAGDPAACGEATPDAASAKCSSPIQVFLEPIQRPKTVEEKAVAAEEEAAEKNGGIRITFVEPPGGAPWTLRNKDDALLCKLPCTRWVGQESGIYIRREEMRPADALTKLRVPSAFSVPVGSSMTASVEPPRGSVFASAIASLASLGVIAGGVAAFILSKPVCYDPATGARVNSYNHSGCPTFLGVNLEETQSVQNGRDPPAWVGPTLTGIGVAGVVASVYWFLWSHGERIVLSPDSQAAMGPAGGGRHLGLTPSGLRVTF